MKDRKFYDRVRKALLLRLTDGSAKTLDEYLADAKELHENRVYYATDRALQAQYISMFEAQGIRVALFDKAIDTQFATMLEQYMGGEVKFLRVDADVADVLKDDGEVLEDEALKSVFANVLGEKTKVRFDALKDESVPAVLNITEESRRMEEMMRLYGMDSGAFPTDSTLVLNTNSPLIRKLSDVAQSDAQKAEKMASYLYSLSLLSQKKFSADEMQSFMKDSFDLLMDL